MVIESSFQPPKWLTSCHLQTILPIFIQPSTLMDLRPERLDLPDGDFLDLAWADENLFEQTPIVILLHGLVGNVNSHYIKRIINAIHQAGYISVLIHFRGSGATPNRLARAYHCGSTDDLGFIVDYINDRYPNSNKAVIGFSMGGNVLLKWLGETPLLKPIDLGIAVSVPFDLASCADTLNQGFARIYQTYLLKDLKLLTLRKLHQIGPIIGINDNQLMSLTTVREYDDLITVPLYGFNDAQDYYRKASCRPYLSGITNKTIIIHAQDDPFMSPEVVPSNHELSMTTQLELSQKGGHLGFINDYGKKISNFWLPQRIIHYLNQEFKQN